MFYLIIATLLSAHFTTYSVNAVTIGCPTNALPFVNAATTKLNFPPPYNLSPIGGTVLYICDPGYDLVGKANVTCLANSRWSRSPLCIKKLVSESKGQIDSAMTLQLLYQPKLISQLNPTLAVRDSIIQQQTVDDYGAAKNSQKIADEYYIIAPANSVTNARIVSVNDHTNYQKQPQPISTTTATTTTTTTTSTPMTTSTSSSTPTTTTTQQPQLYHQSGTGTSSVQLCSPAPKLDFADVTTTSIWPGEMAKEGDTVDYKCFEGFVEQQNYGSLLRMTCASGGIWRSEFDLQSKTPICVPIGANNWMMKPSEFKPAVMLVETPTQPEIMETVNEAPPVDIPMLIRKPSVVEVGLPKPVQEIQGEPILLVPPPDEQPPNTIQEVVIPEDADSPSLIMKKDENDKTALPKPVSPVKVMGNNQNADSLPSEVEKLIAAFQEKAEKENNNVYKMASMSAPFEANNKRPEKEVDVPNLIGQLKSLLEASKTPTKKLITCGPAPEIVSASVVGTSFENRTSKPSDWVQYECEPGLNMVGDAFVICMRDGRWSTVDGSLPLCHAEKTCPEPPKIQLTVIEAVNKSFDLKYAQRMQTYPANTLLRYKCHPSEFYLEDGISEIECKRDGKWTVATIQCIPTFKREFCPPPPLIRGGHPVSFSGLNIGATATYVCDNGHHMLSKATAGCNRSGQWTPLPVCAAFKVRSADRSAPLATISTSTAKP